MLSLLPFLVPCSVAWLPDIEFLSSETDLEVRLTMDAGIVQNSSDVLWLEARIEDGDQHVRLNSDVRGLDIALQPGDPANDPFLERAVAGLGVGAFALTFASFDGAYGPWPTRGVLPEQGQMMLVVQVLKATPSAVAVVSRTTPAPKAQR